MLGFLYRKRGWKLPDHPTMARYGGPYWHYFWPDPGCPPLVRSKCGPHVFNPRFEQPKLYRYPGGKVCPICRARRGGEISPAEAKMLQQIFGTEDECD
jgi:hypothetical protein